jgi:GAF domain-containing protein
LSTSARPFHPHSGPDREAAHRNPGAWRALRETAEALGSADPAEGLDHAVRAAMTLLDADGAGLTLVVGEGRDGTAIPAAVGALAPFHGQTGPLAGSLSEHVLAAGEPRALDTESPDAPSGAAMMARLGLVHLALAPLRAGGEALGTLGVARRRGRAPFTARDLDVLAVLAAQAALAVRCARRRGRWPPPWPRASSWR